MIYITPVMHKLLGVQEPFGVIINIFDLKHRDEDTIDIFAQEITHALKQMIKRPKSDDDGMTRNMDAMTKPCVATLLRKGDADLRDLKRFFMPGQNEDLIELGKKSPDPEHRAFFENGFMNEQYNVTKNALYLKMQGLLNSPIFRRLITGNNGKSTIDLHHALNS